MPRRASSKTITEPGGEPGVHDNLSLLEILLNACLLAALAAIWLFVLVVLPILHLGRKERHGRMRTRR